MLANAKIRFGVHPADHRIEVNGHNITSAVTKVVVIARAGELVETQLTIFAVDMDIEDQMNIALVPFTEGMSWPRRVWSRIRALLL